MLDIYEYIAEMLKFGAVPVAVLDILPKEKRLAIEKFLISQLSFKMVFRIAVSGMVSLLLIYGIPYIAPFLIIIGVFMGYFLHRLSGYAIIQDGRSPVFGCIVGLVESVTALILYWLGVNVALILFWLTLLYGLLYLYILPSLGIIRIIWFLLVGLPAGLGFWFTDRMARIFLGIYSIPNQLIGDRVSFSFTPYQNEASFLSAFTSSMNLLRAIIPNFLEKWEPFYWFFSAASGYVLIVSVFAAIVWIYFIYNSFKFVLFFILLVFARTSKVAHGLLRVEDKGPIPVGGTLLFIIGETLAFVIKTVKALG